MSKLMVLLEIEEQYKAVEDLENKLRNVEDKTHVEKLNELCRIERLNLDDSQKKRDHASKELSKLERLLKTYKEKYDDIENRLYSGFIKDLKQLDLLEKEKEYYKNSIGQAEDLILEEMDSLEKEEAAIAGIQKNLRRYSKKLLDENKAREVALVDLRTKIEGEKTILEKSLGKVEKDLLEMYNQIKVKKGTGTAIVRGNVCTGCNMLIPDRMAEKIKVPEKVYTCENCGRILVSQEILDNI